jgi:uncharacterized protein (DUF934 family)
MSVLVTDAGFGPENWAANWVRPEALAANCPARALDLASDTDPESLRGRLDGIAMIRVDFPDFADGRGFTIARQLRLIGYDGRLRARGYLIADQYAMARRAGFDEVEISDDLAARQGQAQWMARSHWRAHDYQSRLRAAV